jgi:hypothetical protein
LLSLTRNNSLRRLDSSQLPIAKSASDQLPDILRGNPQLLLTVWALRVDLVILKAWVDQVESKITRAILAQDPLVLVLGRDLQLAPALGAIDEVSLDCHIGHAVDFGEWHKLGNLDTISLELRIEQRSASPAVNDIGGHVITASGARASGPSGHDYSFSIKL